MKPKKFRVWAAGDMHYPDIIIFDASGASFAPASGGGGSFRVPLGDVMENSACRDRKGNDMFEADIIECEYHTGIPTGTGLDSWVWHGVVEYGCDAAFHVRRIDNGGSYPMGYSGSAVRRWEVIGNIYQHPHLLEPQ